MEKDPVAALGTTGSVGRILNSFRTVREPETGPFEIAGLSLYV
jgi:hypothetical protein